MDKKDKRKKILKVSGLIGLFLLVFGLSYALFTVTLNGTKKVKVKTGKLELQLLDSNNNPIYITDQNNTTSYEINLDNQVPVDDETGLSTQAFEFKLKNSGNVKAKYTIYLDDVALEEGESRIDDQYVKYSLTKNGTESTPALLSTTVTENERQLDKGTIETDNTTNEYTLKIWIAEDATNEAMDKVFNATLRVEGTQYVAPFKDGTFAATIYNQGIAGDLREVHNGFISNLEEDGLYKYTDEEGAVTYAYRGIDVNNYVDFAGQTWRILRIQEDGTVKLIRDDLLNFNSDKVASNYDTYKGVRFNSRDNRDNGDFLQTDIYAYIMEWYNSEMSDYDEYIAMNNYCFDKSTERTKDGPIFSIGTTGYSNFGLVNRVNWNDWDFTYEKYVDEYDNWDMDLVNKDYNESITWNPSVSCRTDDIVSLKAALITADEYVLGGGGSYEYGITFRNTENYLNDDYSGYWALSPLVYEGAMDGWSIYVINDEASGVFSRNYSAGYTAVRPVITLKVNVSSSSGDGTSEHPYVIN